jgi:hypothetical protein
MKNKPIAFLLFLKVFYFYPDNKHHLRLYISRFPQETLFVIKENLRILCKYPMLTIGKSNSPKETTTVLSGVPAYFV